MRTRAAILPELNASLSVEDVDLDPPKQGEVLVHMVASGVCHTDVSAMHGIFPCMPPVILGHEGAGVVEEVGPGVTTLAKGDHVVVDAIAHCGGCASCLRGEPFYCARGLELTIAGYMLDGTKRFRRGTDELSNFFLQSSFAELTVVPAHIAVKVPNELPLETLAPLACGIQTGSGAVLNTAGVRPGESVAVLGCGGVGLSAVMAARVCGASPIIAVDRLESRLAMARELGASETIQADDGTNVVEAIQTLTGGGVDYGFECIGLGATIRQTVDATRIGGTAVISGAAAVGSEVALDSLGMITKDIKGNVEGSAVPGVFLPLLIDLWRRGSFPFDRLLGRTYAHAKINDAIADMESGDVIKPVIRY